MFDITYMLPTDEYMPTVITDAVTAILFWYLSLFGCISYYSSNGVDYGGNQLVNGVKNSSL